MKSYLFDFLQLWLGWLLDFFEGAPVGIFLILAPFGVFSFFQHCAEVHSTGICGEKKMN